MEAIFQSYTLDDWKNVSIIVQGILTVLLVGAAAYQLLALRNENKKSRTHEICDRWSCDPIVHNAARITRSGWLSGEILKTPEKYRDELITMLNFFENIAIGINRQIYDEEYAFNNLGGIMRIHAKRYLDRNFLLKILPGLTDTAYIELRGLTEKWDSRPNAKPIPKSAIESPANFKKTI